MTAADCTYVCDARTRTRPYTHAHARREGRGCLNEQARAAARTHGIHVWKCRCCHGWTGGRILCGLNGLAPHLFLYGCVPECCARACMHACPFAQNLRAHTHAIECVGPDGQLCCRREPSRGNTVRPSDGQNSRLRAAREKNDPEPLLRSEKDSAGQGCDWRHDPGLFPSRRGLAAGHLLRVQSRGAAAFV